MVLKKLQVIVSKNIVFVTKRRIFMLKVNKKLISLFVILCMSMFFITPGFAASSMDPYTSASMTLRIIIFLKSKCSIFKV